MPFAVIGLGRLGGGEMSYASDIDVVFVYDGTTASDFDVAEKLATRLVSAIGETTSEGSTFRVDARLRPEGNAGPARAIDSTGYRAYYDHWGQTWEFQALTKARVGRGRRRRRRALPRSHADRSSTAIRCPTTGAARSGA